jgi:large subunit ribosomal protein L9
LNIEVILTESDPKLGQRGEIIKVSQGYANNYLLPNKKAILATAASRKGVEAEKAKEAKSQAERLAAAKEMASKVEKLSVSLPMMAGEGDKLYGAVTSQDVQSALQAQGIKIERKDIHLSEPIRKIGNYTVTLKFHPEVSAILKINVSKKS